MDPDGVSFLLLSHYVRSDIFPAGIYIYDVISSTLKTSTSLNKRVMQHKIAVHLTEGSLPPTSTPPEGLRAQGRKDSAENNYYFAGHFPVPPKNTPDGIIFVQPSCPLSLHTAT